MKKNQNLDHTPSASSHDTARILSARNYSNRCYPFKGFYIRPMDEHNQIEGGPNRNEKVSKPKNPHKHPHQQNTHQKPTNSTENSDVSSNTRSSHPNTQNTQNTQNDPTTHHSRHNNQLPRRQNRDTSSKDPNHRGTFAGFALVEHSNLLRNAVFQAVNSPYTFFSSYYATVPISAITEVTETENEGIGDRSGGEYDPANQAGTQCDVNTMHDAGNHAAHVIPIPTFNQYLVSSLDELFNEEYSNTLK